jgi:hypothetical protein
MILPFLLKLHFCELKEKISKIEVAIAALSTYSVAPLFSMFIFPVFCQHTSRKNDFDFETVNHSSLDDFHLFA